MTRLVSVIIPTYGDDVDQCKAIDSVLNQDYHDVEVIVVDDNGEGTRQQMQNADAFKKYDLEPKFHYIVHSKNMGGSAARNTGAKASRGDYLAFLDDDDEYGEGKIRLQMEKICQLGDTWAGTYSSYRVFNNDGKLVRTVQAAPNENLLKSYLKGAVRIGTNAPVIRREAFFSINGFDESFRRHQDWEFFARLLDRYKLLPVPDAYFDRHYRETAGRFDIDQRILFLDKYCEKMALSITSIPKAELNRMLKAKYVGLWLGMLRRKEYSKAKELFCTKSFGIREILVACMETINYAINKQKYGKQF